ncbi:MAG: hypothetical protein HY582_04245 [Candidatus Omnitrophica bacterium]|nr:hypothetical protein [Candidatus Omnitrophota bacterium]
MDNKPLLPANELYTVASINVLGRERNLMRVEEKIVRDDLMYHSAHGLCRVNELIKENRSGKEVLCYALVPKVATRNKVRFVVADSDLGISGFHPLVSVKEADEILEYLKAGDITAIPGNGEPKVASRFAQENHPWKLAEELLSFSNAGVEIKDKRKRQVLERSIKGLVEELALVFQITLKETATKIRKCLGSLSGISPLILGALEQAVRD